MKLETNKRRCYGCGKQSTSEQLLHAPNPFDPEQELSGCPHCYGIDRMQMICDEPGCQNLGTCGTPTTGGGYRWTCHFHVPKS